MKHISKEDLMSVVANKICKTLGKNQFTEEADGQQETKRRICSKLLADKRTANKETAKNPKSSINMSLKYYRCKGSGRLRK